MSKATQTKTSFKETRIGTGENPPAKVQKPRNVGALPAPHKETKQEAVLILLRRKEGATTQAMVKKTGWQEHSVRGFLAGVVRKKLKLNLLAEMSDGKRIYRIAADGASKRSKRAPAIG